MSDRISQAEAERLLVLVKHSLSAAISFPLKGERETFEVAGDDKKDVFVIHIFRGSISRTKCYFSAQIKNRSLLLELNIGQSNRHFNPDGKEIVGDHWHIYNELYDNKTAFPAENINSEAFVENTILFLDKFNVLDKPHINFQEEL